MSKRSPDNLEYGLRFEEAEQEIKRLERELARTPEHTRHEELQARIRAARRAQGR